MLHEIFKGMDNAAEQINENFQNGSIVESGVDAEGGYYEKFGNGVMNAYRKMTLSYQTLRILSETWNFSEEFINDEYVVQVTIESIPTEYRGVMAPEVTYVFKDRVNARVTIPTTVTPFPENTTIDVYVTIKGRWK